MRSSLVPAAVVSIAFLASPVFASPRPEEVQRQRLLDARAIESVYWKHRLWPESNPGPKPSLEQILPEAAFTARIEDAARKSSALRMRWHRPLDAAQLQEELDRMASATRNPGMLRELFSALGDDPGRIAEALARPVLADRLIRSWYGSDPSLHAATRRKAEADAAAVRQPDDLKRAGTGYTEIEYVVRDETAAPGLPARPDLVMLDPEEWTRLIESLTADFACAGGAGALQSGRVGCLQEKPEGFTLSALLSHETRRILVGTATWAKRPFDDWWKSARSRFPAANADLTGRLTLPAVALDCVNDTWRPIRTEFPYSRSGHSAVWTGSEMIVWGGDSVAGLLKTGYRYVPATDTFTPIRSDDSAPAPRSGHVAVWTGARMVVWGAHSNVNGFVTGGRYDPSTDTWSPTRADATTVSSREYFAATWTGSELFIWGGQNPLGGNVLGTGGLYDPVQDTWRPTGTGAGLPEARARATAVWTGSEVIVYGGFKLSATIPPTQIALDTGGRYNPSTNGWFPIAGGGARAAHTAVWTGSEMIVWGGSGPSGGLKTGSRYSPATNTWQPTAVDAATPFFRAGHSAVWTGNRMIIWGGLNQDKTGGVYDPASDHWTPTRADATAPAARIRQTAVWTGTEMIVWGGQSGQFFATGGRYDPVSDTWVPTHYEPIISAGIPAEPGVWTGSEMIFTNQAQGRYEPAIDAWAAMAAPPPAIPGYGGPLVWTGTEVIIWSGSSGGRYNPMTDSWAAVATTGAPSPRQWHTAVWSGSEMIIWGGWQNFDLNTGARYSPSSNSWTPTRADATTPAGRYFHSAVWSGSEMIVWGGTSEDNALVFATGGRYDPATDIWTPTSAQPGTPGTRYWHSAVWSGKEMIVWGGFPALGGVAPSNTGWIYAPDSDQWRATVVDPATPSARYLHSAQWTGHEMIVWGGTVTQGSGLSSGGRYDPAADAWSPTRDDATTPLKRWDAASAWTGSEFLVWGGTVANTGGAYCACLGPMATWFADADGDGYGDDAVSLQSCVPQAGYVTGGSDCDDGNAGAWAPPGEAQDLAFTSATDLAWAAPSATGAAALTYDVLRSADPDDFLGAATCLISGTASLTTADSDVPLPGGAFFYLVRATNACPAGAGSLGARSDGTPRPGRSCT